MPLKYCDKGTEVEDILNIPSLSDEIDLDPEVQKALALGNMGCPGYPDPQSKGAELTLHSLPFVINPSFCCQMPNVCIYLEIRAIQVYRFLNRLLEVKDKKTLEVL